MEAHQDFKAGRGGDRQEIVIRDDQMDFAALLDLVKERRRNHRRLGLIDSGAFDPFQMEWLGEAGADIYTSNRARQSLNEFVLIGRAATKGDAVTAYFHHGPFLSEEKEKTVPFSALKEMGRSGIDIHLSNKHGAHEWEKLEELADACAAGASRLVIYHHGPLGPEIESLARRGAWIHVSDASLRNDGDVVLLTDCLAAARVRGVQLIFHLEHSLPLAWLEDIFAAGAFVLFKIPPTDYRSWLRPFEQASKKRRPDFRATYIDATFLL
jgi:hypothetical protein